MSQIINLTLNSPISKLHFPESPAEGLAAFEVQTSIFEDYTASCTAPGDNNELKHSPIRSDNPDRIKVIAAP